MSLISTTRKKIALLLVAILTVGAATVLFQSPASAAGRYKKLGSVSKSHYPPKNDNYKIVVRARMVKDTKKNRWRSEVRVKCYWRTGSLGFWNPGVKCSFNEIGLSTITYNSKTKNKKEITHDHFPAINDDNGNVTRRSEWKKIRKGLKVKSYTHIDVARVGGSPSFCWQNGQCVTNSKWVKVK